MKNKFFPLISILILIVLLGTATTCNMCGLNLTTDTTTSTTEESQTGNTSTQASETEETTKVTIAEDTNEEKTTDTAKSSSTETAKSSSTDSQAIAPTIKLQIYEGPTYSQADDVCYYRIEAIVTGSPIPTVTFSKDDSNGSFGSKKVQINLSKNLLSYKLIANAKNSAGESSTSLDLKWGCIQQQPVEKTVELHPSILGTVGPAGFLDVNFLAIGDLWWNADSRGRFAFDVSSLAGKEIKYAKLTLANPYLSSDPCNFKGDIVIYYNDFLAGGFTGADYWSPAYAGPQKFSWNAEPLEFATDFLKVKVAERATAHLELQFGIGYENPAIGGIPDVNELRVYHGDNITLTITYNE